MADRREEHAFLGRVLVAVGDLRRGVVDELALPIGREQADLLAGKQRCGVDEVTLDHRSRASLESSGNNDLDRHDALAITFADDGVVGQPVPKVKDITGRVRLEIETASGVRHRSASLSPRAHAEPYSFRVSSTWAQGLFRSLPQRRHRISRRG